jgi:hypothetical protein
VNSVMSNKTVFYFLFVVCIHQKMFLRTLLHSSLRRRDKRFAIHDEQFLYESGHKIKLYEYMWANLAKSTSVILC